MDAEVRQILVGMKERLSVGWVQGRLHSADRETGCLVGSGISAGHEGRDYNIRKVAELAEPKFYSGRGDGTGPRTYSIYTEGPLYHALTLLADELGLENQRALSAWNDNPERTRAEVVALIDAVLTKDTNRVRVILAEVRDTELA